MADEAPRVQPLPNACERDAQTLEARRHAVDHEQLKTRVW